MNSTGTDLTDLVRDRKADLGLSYERLAKHCIDPKTGEQTVKYSWLHRLATGQPVIAPDLSQLRGLAEGMKVPLGRVQDAAAAQFFGIQAVWSDSGDARALVQQAEQLTPEQREAVRRLMETLARREDSGTDG